MPRYTAHAPGTFSFAGLVCPDRHVARAFYGELLGWSYEELLVGPGHVFTICRRDGETTASINELPAEAVAPHWDSYLTVTDLPAAVARGTGLGGAGIFGPIDVLSPDGGQVGGLAMLNDPAGHGFALWRAGDSIGASLLHEPGAVAATELTTVEPASAARFYAELFGWPDDGTAPPVRPVRDGVPAGWLPYFGAQDVAASTDAAVRLGGTCLERTAGRRAILADPAGAVFGLVELLTTREES
ncbi:VOC family protein [Dactylosporangium sp. NPDC051541]|uniref:VOC family protein n=1 Tax=Dactylosporangium sp. NPDC051541 TaxID=3363977 RepID=UPI00379E0C02